MSKRINVNDLSMASSSCNFDKKEGYLHEFGSQPILNKTVATMHVQHNIINFEENVTPKNNPKGDQESQMNNTTNSGWPHLSKTKYSNEVKSEC